MIAILAAWTFLRTKTGLILAAIAAGALVLWRVVRGLKAQGRAEAQAEQRRTDDAAVDQAQRARDAAAGRSTDDLRGRVSRWQRDQ